MANLIGISGKKQSCKDTVGKIIQYLTRDYVYIDYSFDQYFSLETTKDFEVKMFANKLKDIVCLLIGCTKEQLEDETFKNKYLLDDWLDVNYATNVVDIDLKNKSTVRELLQVLGTEAGRNVIHTNIWVNSLFSEYKYPNCDSIPGKICFGHKNPNWIITDVRFPNEAEKIKEKGGLLIRIESPRCNYNDTHSSETALDDYGGKGDEVRTDRWDSIIFNDGTIEELIEKVKKVLIKHKIIENV
jgi:hypothetical protein